MGIKHTEISTESLLNRFIKSGRITFGDVVGSSEEEIMNKILKEVHKYKITPPKEGSKDKRWFTYVPDTTKKRGSRRFCANSEKELETALLEFYADTIDKLNNANLTMGEMFQKWTEYREFFCKAQNKKKSLCPYTINRYRREYREYVQGTMLDKAIMSDITSGFLEKELTTIVKENHLKERFSRNLLGYFRQCFAYARRERLISENEFDFVDTDRILSFAEVNPVDLADDEERVLTDNELSALVMATREHEKKHPYYMPDYAIELAALTGMRVGELAALHKMSVNYDKGYLEIDYSEHRIDYEDHSEIVVDEPKCLKHRKFPINDAIRELFERIDALGLVSEFVFARQNGERYTGHDISCACDRRAKEAGIDSNVSVHRIRRTVASILRTKYSAKKVSSLLGHTERTDDEYYYYDNSEYSDKLDAANYLSGNIIPFEPCKADNKLAQI